MRLSTMLDYSRGVKESGGPRRRPRAGRPRHRVGGRGLRLRRAQPDGVPGRPHRRAIEIGSAILPIYSRTPVLLAQTAAGIDAAERGDGSSSASGRRGPRSSRAGTASPYTEPLERHPRDHRASAAGCGAARCSTNDGPLPHPPARRTRGRAWARRSSSSPTPCAPTSPSGWPRMGPKNVAMTAEVADGWFPFLFIPERRPPGVGRGAGRRRRQKRAAGLGPLEIAAGGLVAIGEGLEPCASSPGA